MRVSEPCNRRALENAHRALRFLEEVTGTQKEDKITALQIYEIIYQEHLSSAAPGQASKQALRFFVSIVSALERFVMDTDMAPFLRIYSWWILLQCWCTLRFSDHRGVNPKAVRVIGSSMTALLTWSKTIGTDKAVGSRPHIVTPVVSSSTQPD